MDNERLPDQSRFINVKLAVGIVLAGFIVLFLIQNVGVVEIQFLVWSFFISRSLLIFIVFAIGVVVGWSWHSLSSRRRRRGEAGGNI